MANFSIAPAENGLIFTIQAIGGLTIGFLILFFSSRWNRLIALALVVFSAVIGTIGTAIAGSYSILLPVSFAAGLGFTGFDILSNGAVAELYPERKNTLVPLLHAFFSVGAMLSPLFVAALVTPETPSTYASPYYIIAGILLVVAVVTLFVIRKITPPARSEKNSLALFKTKTAWLLAIVVYLFFGYLNAISLWLPTFCLEEVNMSFTDSAFIMTLFFIGVIIVRFSSPLFLKKFTARSIFIVFSLASAITMAVAIISKNPDTIRVLTPIGGFFQGGNVALLILIACSYFPGKSASASALVLVAGSFAVMTVPFLVGFFAESFGFQIPLLVACAMLVLAVVVCAVMKKPEQDVPLIDVREIPSEISE